VKNTLFGGKTARKKLPYREGEKKQVAKKKKSGKNIKIN
jgi:hypothetical protein